VLPKILTQTVRVSERWEKAVEIAEKFNSLPRVQQRYTQTTDRQTDDRRTAHAIRRT